MEYPVEQFTDEERHRLAPHFTNLDRPVFGLVNLPETVKGALFARYSRYPGTLRRLFLEEFADDVDAWGSRFDSAEGERAAQLYERVFVGYGDDSVAQLGGAHIAVRVGLERAHQGAPARAPRGLSRAVHPLHPVRRGDARRRLPLLARPLARARVRRGDGLPVRLVRRGAAAGRGLGGRALPARRGRARVGPPPVDPREGARPAARPAAGGIALAHGDLRHRPGLRAARDAPARLAAPGGARLRPDDSHRAEGDHAELRLAGGPPRARR